MTGAGGGAAAAGVGAAGAFAWVGAGFCMQVPTRIRDSGFSAHAFGSAFRAEARYHTPHVRGNHPRSTLEQHSAGLAQLRADRYAGLPASPVRPAARLGIPGLPGRDPLAVRARAWDLSPRAADVDAVRGPGRLRPHRS